MSDPDLIFHHSAKHFHTKEEEFNEHGISLYPLISIKDIKCLGEKMNGTGRCVFRSDNDKYKNYLYCESSKESNKKLFFTIYFTANIRLESIIIGMENKNKIANKLILFNDKYDKINNWNDIKNNYKSSDQIINLSFNNSFKKQYEIKRTKFCKLNILKMLFVKDDKINDNIRINFIELKGELIDLIFRNSVNTKIGKHPNSDSHDSIYEVDGQKNKKLDHTAY